MRALLREATRPFHARVDALGSGLDLRTRSGYGALLCAHASVLPGLETVLSAGPVPPDWSQRRRTDALLGDLKVLGLAPGTVLVPPALDDPAARLGALYVIEGSRLGNEVLRRQVIDAWPEAPVAFLAHGANAGLWQRFVAWLATFAADAAALDVAARGAGAVFELYERAFLEQLSRARENSGRGGVPAG
ncbi:heme oxygenase [Endobacter medicaginis]|uniref:Heme oxygenase n=1 Tax=Endobacter medicaginis TaxID=1181271 RepID=A0A839USG5_9PROT|nr:biliverdin-producing heme oxygenase [Endobacter medicaginis]MBB3172726.1 heme oxygenase [Endobacter medicaginis]MCX5474333.1 biliverdin-producing heme oxygenase [Endobacter medicaginis]NVN30218.1 biliverdin-producing heme oxygenase [Endobacter medicaginis]